MTAKKHQFCHACGVAYANLTWPRTCLACGEQTWRNPTPVAVVIVPVGATGVLLVRRGIDPKRGELALPGGYVEHGETWETAAAREVHEECGITITGVRLATVRSAPNAMLIFCEAEPISKADLDAPWASDAETLERVVVDAPVELAFPLHTELLKAYFDVTAPWEPLFVMDTN